jgi:hypothetical protein
MNEAWYMAGQIKTIIDQIIQERSKGNRTLMHTTKTKLILKGLNPDKWSLLSDDNPEVLAKVKTIAAEFGISV